MSSHLPAVTEVSVALGDGLSLPQKRPAISTSAARDALATFNCRSVGLKLIPHIVQEMEVVLYILVDVAQRLEESRDFSRTKLENDLREAARRLTASPA